MPEKPQFNHERDTSGNAYRDFPPPVFMPTAENQQHRTIMKKLGDTVVGAARNFLEAYRAYRGFDQPFPPEDRSSFPEK